ncbi:Archaeal/vacuolar-type H+-ATPase subunit F [Methanonatronarchaeum thermophilum]|uniref:A-type ATP synthase subunit F n=1 Tax=Methanonatronarchaeum thermophilum TaxID=1927129 RepID=A0A1Y3GI95_9EURY|nr:V-type ATP synthase subunit F [Methanonatronarchaeum thermophilum]OUJ19126.1 Archaeal/vacuolar-type H+-ATPase subunit F [Methanonatronarchaeum thermophilum]
MKVAVVADEDTVTGFKLAGVKEASVAKEGDEFEDALYELSDEIGIVITTERIAEENRESLKRFRDRRDVFPIIVEIPDKHGSTQSQLQEMVKKAVGVEIDLEDI